MGDEGVRINEGVSLSLGKSCRTVMYWSLPSSLSRLSRSAAYLARRASVSREAAIATGCSCDHFARHPLRPARNVNEFRGPAENFARRLLNDHVCRLNPGPLSRVAA